MKRIAMIIMTVALMVSIAGVAAAQSGTQRPERRAARQELRIRQGERIRLHRALDRQRARIWQLKHNGRAI